MPIPFVPPPAIAALIAEPVPGQIALMNFTPCCATNLNPYPTPATPLTLNINSFAVSNYISLPLSGAINATSIDCIISNI